MKRERFVVSHGSRSNSSQALGAAAYLSLMDRTD
jgi:hypothetical protein